MSFDKVNGLMENLSLHIWEAGVNSFKYRFQNVMKGRKFNFEKFSTNLVGIESILNTRPLP